MPNPTATLLDQLVEYLPAWSVERVEGIDHGAYLIHQATGAAVFARTIHGGRVELSPTSPPGLLGPDERYTYGYSDVKISVDGGRPVRVLAAAIERRLLGKALDWHAERTAAVTELRERLDVRQRTLVEIAGDTGTIPADRCDRVEFRLGTGWATVTVYSPGRFTFDASLIDRATLDRVLAAMRESAHA